MKISVKRKIIIIGPKHATNLQIYSVMQLDILKQRAQTQY
jgi:hypothetical protein